MRVILGTVLAAAVSTAALAAPDVLYVNANVLTVDPDFNTVQAVAITGDKITAVGKDADIRRLASPSTKVIDLGGKTLMPGFIDNHIHLTQPLQSWKYGGMINSIPDWLRGADSLPELLTILERRAAETPEGEWIVGTLAREDFPNHLLPTRKDLDKAAPNHPVALGRGPHTLAVNSKALEAAKITKDSRPAGGKGEIGRDSGGELNGLFYEAAMHPFFKVMPKDFSLMGQPLDPQRPEKGWPIMLGQLVSMGITSGNVAGILREDIAKVEAMYQAHGDTLPRLTLQFALLPGAGLFGDAEKSLRHSLTEMDALKDRESVFKHPKLKMGAIKMNVDGGLSAPIIRNIREYESRPGFHGEYRIPEKNLYAVIKRARELDWQLGLHTMGDASTALVVDQIVQAEAEVPGRPDVRNYMHHVSVLPPEETMKKMAQHKIAVASQPGFLLSLGAYANEALWPDQEASQQPAGSFLGRGIRVSFGSDGAPYGPFAALYAAVTRKGWDGKVYGPGEKVSVQDAIRMHTIGSAYFTFDEANRGSIEAGKFADLIVLSADPLAIDPEEIKNLTVLRTIIGGKEVYALQRQ